MAHIQLRIGEGGAWVFFAHDADLVTAVVQGIPWPLRALCGWIVRGILRRALRKAHQDRDAAVALAIEALRREREAIRATLPRL